ncbi:MAG: methyltransferase domain-containing protein, partial [Acidobacteriaceae bacterium]|nr:methyltransferase domain-containing protein [Acidobacteriaceae bacterium]
MSNEAASAGAPDPALVWHTLNGYQRTAVLKGAIELDLFTAVGEGAETPASLATRCRASERGMRILCDYLTVLGFLSKQDGKYSLTPTSAVFLDHRSPASMSSAVKFLASPKLMSAFSDVAETVRRGTTLLPEGGSMNEAEFGGEWITFAESMKPLIAPAAEHMAKVAVEGGTHPRKVLDIAAGHGGFGIAVASRAPQATIVAQDLAGVLKVAQENARKAGVIDRYQLLPGDAFKVDFGTGYDLVLLTNFLHHFDESTCERLLKRIHASMTPDGRVMTLEFIPNSDRVSPPIAAMFSMV